MTFVVTDACIKCVYTDCVEVCPMDCFFEGPNFLAIHPDECIDCAMCVAECPVGAIYSDLDLPDSQREFLALNARLSQAPGWQRISARKAPPADHADWAGVPGKRDLLITEAGK